MSDGSWTDRNITILLGAIFASLFVLAALMSQRAFRSEGQYWEQRSIVEHLTRTCKQAADGSAVCSPRAFDPIPTTVKP